MVPGGRTFKLEELAAEAGVSIRTVRYYVQRGLLPAPEFRARGTAYGEDHLLRLKAIRHLQARFLPLEAIAGVLSQCDAGGLRTLAEGEPPEGLGKPASETSAIASPEIAPPALERAGIERAGIERAGIDKHAFERSVTNTTGSSLIGQAGREGAGWKRWELAPGLELHLSDDADHAVRELAEKLRSLAQKGETR